MAAYLTAAITNKLFGKVDWAGTTIPNHCANRTSSGGVKDEHPIPDRHHQPPTPMSTVCSFAALSAAIRMAGDSR